MQGADFIKLLHQRNFGNGHFLKDVNHSLEWIIKEYEVSTVNKATPASLSGTVERIGGGQCRICLSILSFGMKAETLNSIFAASANKGRADILGFEADAAVFISMGESGEIIVNIAEVQELLEKMRENNYPPVRHSEAYRSAYNPTYRVVDEMFCAEESLLSLCSDEQENTLNKLLIS
ncbi:MAG: hypothetical protein FWC95_01985 [Defluviitaleaceae bacterium]|nr:hypothetical protein [Defluviitaleaceae bacterium]